MPKFSRLLAIACLLGTLSGSALVTDAKAGPLLDWLFHRRTTSVGYCPTTTAYSSFAAANPCNQVCQRVLVSYQPYTSYRTTWAQVPVTYFRPVSTTDPCTDCPVTSMQPCTTYTWQVQRVPVCSYRPVYQTVAAAAVPTATTVAQPIMAAQPAGGCACAGQSAPGIPSIQMPAQMPATPNYGANGYGVPGYAPGTGSPMPATPADVAPTLNSQGALPGQSGTSVLNYPPYGMPYGIQGQPVPANVQQQQPIQESSPAAAQQEPSTNGASTYPRGFFNTPARLQDIKPIPDPDAPRIESPGREMPQLLNPHDKMAQRPARWAYTPISWPNPATAPQAKPAANDQGWRSVRNR